LSTDRGIIIERRRAMAGPLAALAVAVGATGCSSGVGTEVSTSIPPPPGVIEMTHEAPAHPDDGLYRFIVTPAPALASAPVEVVEQAEAAETTGTADQERRTHWSIPSGHDVGMADGSTLVFQDGQPGYLDADGSFVPIDGASADDADNDDEGEDASPYGHPLIDALAANGAVTSVTAIGDGSFAVVTSSPDVLDDPGLSVIEDLPVGFTDEYGPYQWAVENNGSNLDQVSSPPPQAVDADVDGLEAVSAATGRGIVVAVVDSGVDFSHPDLAGKSWVNEDDDCTNGVDDDANGYVDDCRGWDFAANDNEPFVPGHHAHGTHVAGIIGATAGNGIGISGVAPDVVIMDLSVSPTGSMTTSSIARAIRYAVDNGADVVNLSLGTSPGAPIEAVGPMVDAVRYAEANGVLLAVAAGNDSVHLDTAPVYPASIEATNMLVIGASSPTDTRASFSNFGTAVDLFAPGELIVSTTPGGDYNFMSGTSQATPVAAAAAAMVLQTQPGADPATVIDQLVGTADELAALASYTPSSARLNAARAVGLQPDLASGSGDIVTVRDLSGLEGGGEVHAIIDLNFPGGQYEQPFHWEASLVAMVDGGYYGIVNLPVRVGWGTEPEHTDDRGAVMLSEYPQATVEIATELPAGAYVLVVEAVPRTDPTVRLGDAFITKFVVGEPAQDETDGGSGDVGTGDGDVGTGGGTGTDPDSAPTDPGDGGASDPTDPGDGGVWFPSDPGDGGASDPTDPGDGGVWFPSDPGDGSTGGSGSGSAGGSGGGTSSPPSTGGGGTSGGSTSGGATGGGSAGGGDSGTTRPAPDIPSGPVDTSNGEWAIETIVPRSGPVRSETFVTMTGSFPAPVHVWFGDRPGTVFVQADTWLMVQAPYVETPQVVDISLRTSADGEVLRAPEAFAYVSLDGGTTISPQPDPGSGGPGSGDSGSGDTGSGGDDSVSFPPPVDPSEPAPVAPAPDDGSTDGGGDTSTGGDDGDKTRQRQARALPTGDAEQLANGLTGRPLDGLPVIGDVPACTSNPCRTRRIGS
jgi:subtilisin family serine protease